MKHFTRRDFFGCSLILLAGLSAWGAWAAFFETLPDPDLVHVVTTLLWFFVTGSVFLLGAVVWRSLGWRFLGIAALLVPSFFFLITGYHLLFVLLSSLVVLLGVQSIQRELTDQIRFRFVANVRAGSLSVVIGIALALSSAYFGSIRTESWEELVPRFSIGEGTAVALIKTVAYLYPEWQNLADEGMTVDGFLLSLEKDETAAPSGTAPSVSLGVESSVPLPVLAEYLRQHGASQGTLSGETLSQELMLLNGREQIAGLVGRPVRGDEKIADVFSMAIQRKAVAVLSGDQVSRHLSPAIVPLILALLLFFTLLPLGSLLALFWVMGSFLLFRLALFFGWVKIERVPREQEVLLP